VGSSNLNASGIDGGVEWNLGVDRVEQLVTGFDSLWADGRSTRPSRKCANSSECRVLPCIEGDLGYRSYTIVKSSYTYRASGDKNASQFSTVSIALRASVTPRPYVLASD